MENSNDRTRERILIAGNGMASHRLCARLVESGAAETHQVLVVGEEPRPAYDRVHLTEYLGGKSAEELTLAPASWYRDNGITLYTGRRVARICRDSHTAITACNSRIPYDKLVLATGSAPFVPKAPGIEKQGVFLYRTIEDLDAIRAYATRCRSAAVIGGGLLGLEAAKAVHDAGLKTTVVEFAPRLMPRQLDQCGSDFLVDKIAALGVDVLLNRNTERVLGENQVEGIKFTDGTLLSVDMIVVSAGIRPRDELARACGLKVHDRGGVCVNNFLQTSDPDIYAVGETANHFGMVYGLVGPCYGMADALALTLSGAPTAFAGADTSTRLKLMGVDVASFGDAFAGPENGRVVEFRDALAGVYKHLVVSRDGRKLIGGILVGDAREYAQLLHFCKSGDDLPCSIGELLGHSAGTGAAVPALDLIGGAVQICSCNNVSKAAIVAAIRDQEIAAIGPLKCATKAGTGCGGCMPLVQKILDEELARAGRAGKRGLCPHFDLSRQELFQIVKVRKYRTFEQVIKDHGRGNGCEVCKPAIASILASLWNEFIVKEDLETIQDTNDRYLANIQRGGTYSVVPRVPGGEITPEKLIALGRVAKKYGLYTKITGGQRIDLFGARVDQLPAIWTDLVDAGFESGHAYGKAVRTVKSCVGSTWCRFGVQDSVAFAIRIENRYKGIRAPHKIKLAVSGCVRECAEAQSKDIGLIATEKGWNLYVCGNGGARPRHADLFATDLDGETAIRYIDRILMYYIHTADKLTRTATWLENLEGGLEHLRGVVIADSLGIAEQLDSDMARLVDTYTCEWTEVVNDPAKQMRFRQFANSADAGNGHALVPVREQKIPAPWPREEWIKPSTEDAFDSSWFNVGRTADFPRNGGAAVKYGKAQIAVFNFASRGEWFATQNLCPHKHEMALARGILGDAGGDPKIACPFHKKTFSLKDGRCMSGERLEIYTFPVRIENDSVLVCLPPEHVLEERMQADAAPCNRACSVAGPRPAEPRRQMTSATPAN